MSDNEAIGELLIQFADGQRALLSKFANDLAVVVERNNELAVAQSRLAAVEAVCAAIEDETGRAGRNLPSYNEGFVDGADDAVDRIRAALKGPTP